jgi:hypothetical protein
MLSAEGVRPIYLHILVNWDPVWQAGCGYRPNERTNYAPASLPSRFEGQRGPTLTAKSNARPRGVETAQRRFLRVFHAVPGRHG